MPRCSLFGDCSYLILFWLYSHIWGVWRRRFAGKRYARVVCFILSDNLVVHCYQTNESLYVFLLCFQISYSPMFAMRPLVHMSLELSIYCIREGGQYIYGIRNFSPLYQSYKTTNCHVKHKCKIGPLYRRQVFHPRLQNIARGISC